jgi:RHS repeat-associated protein
VGNRTAQTKADGVVIAYSFDPNNRLVATNYPGGAVAYTYDAVGNRTAMTDTTGVTRYTYDALDRMLVVVQPNGTLTYTYDLNNNRTALTYPDGGTVAYTHDAAGRLLTVTDWDSRVTTYAYDAAGRQTGMAYPNGVQAVSTYDNADRLLSIVHTSPVSGVIASASYTLDAAGNRLTMTDLDGLTTYGYDALHRLTGVTYPDGEQVTYAYDAMGNRLAMTSSVDGATTYNYDAGDRLLSYSGPGGTVNLAWDANGNMIGKGDAAYTFGALNRLSSVTEGAESSSYIYNGDGVQAQRNINGSVTSYIMDVATGLEVTLESNEGTYTNRYIFGNALLGQSGSDNSISFYHADGLGSTRALSKMTGEATAQYTYDVFGTTRMHIGNSNTEFTFAGEQWDETSGLIYLRARYYDPAVGRFVSKDVWPGSPGSNQTQHRYTYGNNNPVLYTDPLGLFGIIDGIDWSLTFLNIAAGDESPTSPGVVNKAVGTAAKESGMTSVSQISKGVGAGISGYNTGKQLDQIWADPTDAELNEFARSTYGRSMSAEDMSDPLIRDIVRLDHHYTTRPKKIITSVDVTLSTVGGPMSTGYKLVKAPSLIQQLWLRLTGQTNRGSQSTMGSYSDSQAPVSGSMGTAPGRSK